MKLGEQIRIHYLEHSAFVCETSQHLILFDIGLVPPRPPELDPDWANIFSSHKPVVVLSSHDHADHYDAQVQRHCDQADGCRFIAGEFGKSAGNTIRVDPGEDRIIDDFRIITVAATDKGVAAMLVFPEITLYFGGDHAIWDDLPSFDKPYRTSMEKLAKTGIRPDLAFLAVATSDGYQEDALLDGCRLAMTRLKPHGVVPMHAFGYESFYQRFSERTSDIGIPVAQLRHSGDRFIFDGTGFLAAQ